MPKNVTSGHRVRALTTSYLSLLVSCSLIATPASSAHAVTSHSSTEPSPAAVSVSGSTPSEPATALTPEPAATSQSSSSAAPRTSGPQHTARPHQLEENPQSQSETPLKAAGTNRAAAGPTPPAPRKTKAVAITSTAKIGHGWRGRTVFPGDWNRDGHADLMLARPDGDLYLYLGQPGNRFAKPTKIGHGWNGVQDILGVGDWNGDGHPDLIGRFKNGDLYFYQGNGRSIQSSRRVGNGWGKFREVAPVFKGSNGHPALLGLNNSGAAVLYPTNGRTSFAKPVTVAKDWTGFSRIAAVGDWDMNGRTDQIAVDSRGALRYLATNKNGVGYTHYQIGPGGWLSMNTVGEARDKTGTRIWAVHNNGDLYSYGVRTAQPTTANAVITRTTSADLAGYHHSGCPMAASRLRTIRVNYWDYSGKVKRGAIVVRDDRASQVAAAFTDMFKAKFAIARMELPTRWKGNDPNMMAANDTSGYNCRKVTGNPYRWSPHAYGYAVDVNPVQNPYRDPNGRWYPSTAYATKRPAGVKGMNYRNGPSVKAFKSRGWSWFEGWDWQHFERK